MNVAAPAVPTPADSSAATPSATAADNGLDPNDFITLLVAQLKNQDPTSPMDPTQFVTQLVQFNSLEQLISINQDLTPAAPTAATAPSGAPVAATRAAANAINSSTTVQS